MDLHWHKVTDLRMSLAAPGCDLGLGQSQVVFPCITTGNGLLAPGLFDYYLAFKSLKHFLPQNNLPIY